MGTLLVKLDIKSAYQLIPVHLLDCPLLGVQWGGMNYVDRVLPFGLWSAPKVFTAVADALQCVMGYRGVSAINHYLDDFITMGPAGSDECRVNLGQIIAICTELGVPLAADKLEGPSDGLIFLGIEIDTRAGQLRLPADKLSQLRDLLAQWQPRRSCQRRQLESLVRTLHYACFVVKSRRAFLRQIIDR